MFRDGCQSAMCKGIAAPQEYVLTLSSNKRTVNEFLELFFTITNVAFPPPIPTDGEKAT
jgi:hypothetical protein